MPWRIVLSSAQRQRRRASCRLRNLTEFRHQWNTYVYLSLLSLVPQAYPSLSFAESYRGSSSMKACYPGREKDERFHKTLRRLQATLPCYSTTWRLSIRGVRSSAPFPFPSPNPSFLHLSSPLLRSESIRYLSFPLRRFTYAPLIVGDSITHAFMDTTHISYLYT